MLKKTIYRTLLLFLSFNTLISFSQGEANIWYFGANAGLDFNTSPPTPLTNGALSTSEGCAAISNKNGNLVFYTDGSTVWNKNHVPMPNGTGLLGNSSSAQSAVIVPFPGTYNMITRSYDKYYIVTVDYNGGANGVRYSEVDMTLNGGLGNVTANKNIYLFGTTTTEKVCVAQHSNLCDFWVITKPVNTADFNAYRIASSGFNITPVVSSVSPVNADYFYLKSSPDSKIIANCNGATSALEVYDFNNTTGVLTPKFSVANASSASYGVEFSPDNKLLYNTGINGVANADVYQYDLTAANNVAFNSSKTLIGTSATASAGYKVGALQLGPDGKIYIALVSDTKISVINNPNVAGLGCGFSDRTVDLAGRTCVLGLPALVTSLITAEQKITTQIICNTNINYQLAITNTVNVNAVNWLLTPLSNPSQTIMATGLTTTVTVSLDTYSIQALISYVCYNDLITSTLTVIPTPTLSVNSVTICEGLSDVLTVSGANSYTWSPANTLDVSTGNQVTASPTITTNYTVAGTNTLGCIITTTTDVIVNPNPIPSFTFNAACVGSATSFTDSSTPTSGPNAVTNWLWDFDNDGNLDDFNENPTHIYPTAGNYTVNLFVTNVNTGCLDNLTKTLTVNAPPSVYAINTNSQCDTTKIDWMNFSNVTPGLATGAFGGYSISVTQSNNGLFAHAGMYGVGSFPTQYSVATITNGIANNQAGLFTFCFNEPVINPQISLSSIGQSGIIVPVNTSVPYEVVWTGINMQYPSNTQFIGEEGYTIIRFPGIHTCISFDYLVTENYCTIGFGLMDVKCQKDTICPNEPVAFLARGASTYSWSTGATTNTVLVNPTANTQYTVTGTSVNGCTNSTVIGIDVYTVSPIVVNSASICVGQQTATLSTTGAVTYVWNDAVTLSSSTGSVVTATPSSSTDYTIIATDKNSCIQTATTNVHVYPLPIIIATSNTLCIGNSSAIDALGASTYTWIPSTTLNTANNATVIATPTITTDYTVTGTDNNGCTNTASTTVVVNPLPNITVTSNTICVGKSGDLLANGASTYTWHSSITLNANTGTTVTANPIITTIYTVTGTDNNNCVNTQTTSVIVNNLPNVTVTPSFSMCSSNTGTLVANGADTYTWSPSITLSSSTGSVVNANQIALQTYTVIGQDAATTCTNVAVTTISITTTPTVIVVATPTIICPQSSSTLTASGATNYLWLPFLTLGNSVVASPTVNTTYTVVGANGSCTNTAEVAVTVTVNPTIVATTETICSGSSANLTVSGGVTYTWTPASFLNSTTGAAVISSAPITKQYIVSGSSPLGCISSATVDVTVVSTPTVSVVANPITICTGSSSVLSANGASSYTWSPAASVNNVNSANVIATPVVTTIYSIVGENSLGTTSCIDTKTIQIIVRPKIIPLMSLNEAICEGQSTKIYAKGGNVYHWLPIVGVSKPNDSVTVVKPSTTTVYTVSVSYNNLCAETGTVEITINPLPLVNAGKDSTINIDESIVLQGTGNVNVGFLSPDGIPLVCNWCSVVEVFPKENTCYRLEGFSDKGCKATDDVCITVTKEWDVYIPNAFSPNGDVFNEYFLPQGFGITGIDLFIFDRWGTKIFQEENTKLGWDGTLKNVICEQGVYVYKVTIRSMNGEVTQRTGHVTLLGKSK